MRVECGSAAGGYDCLLQVAELDARVREVEPEDGIIGAVTGGLAEGVGSLRPALALAQIEAALILGLGAGIAVARARNRGPMAYIT